ncbi:3-oxoacyl-[acyl-carrier-protein] synthase III C-terminal domain-containing protein [Eleftheria terrae]|uniref:3-oxoacyl-[acyl-carrier-protein] synthase III C-terminal domain-containing protein n=1 Tax=Eleftheria terrae TaxID=1597781 RepID=UPI00263AC008|nr:3-oxoacyl-[acyl-carrier-protein] synthase III C-terminal domain-containing protein [Eleftheria terrae]WKB53558.1 ketoacyl-ACP synthase III [Eleftheria terrae]
MIPLHILSTGKALPDHCVTSAELDGRLGLRPGQVEKKSGVVHRFHAGNDDSQSGLAAAALRDAMARGGVAPASIDLLISASGVAEQALPSTACRIVEPAGLRIGMPAFDVNASCLGFLAALQVAAGLLASGAYRRIAIVASDLASRGLDWNEPEASLIFGDGAAAAIVEAGPGGCGIAAQRLETYPQGKAWCEVRAGGTRRNPRVGLLPSDHLFSMDGKRVFKLAAGLMDGFLARLFEGSGHRLDQMDAVVPHQASHLSMSHLRKRLGIPADALVDIYARHGNQVSASLPTALHEAIQTRRVGPGSRVLLLGSAAGLTLGGMVLVL